MKLTTFNISGKKEPTALELDTKSLGAKVNTALLAQAIRIYTVNSHQNTSKVKTRGEVVGSTKKIYRQKGTGNARHGARYAPIFVGGGVAHGPKGIRPANLVLPLKMRRAALASALLLKSQDESLVGLVKAELADGKTSSVVKFLTLATNHPKNKVLIVTDQQTPKLFQSLKNLQGVAMKRASLLSAFDVIKNDKLILTKDAIETLLTRLKGPKS
jgi:large subunit ribosomal protein L4